MLHSHLNSISVVACRTGGLAGMSAKRDTRARTATTLALVFALRVRESRFALCAANPPVRQAISVDINLVPRAFTFEIASQFQSEKPWERGCS